MTVRAHLHFREGVPVKVDDRSSQIEYFGQWEGVSTGNPTVSGGTSSALVASRGGFTISFNGTQIQVYGIVLATFNGGNFTSIHSTYSIDGQYAGSYTAPNTAKENDGVRFFNSAILPAGIHSLTVEIGGTSQSSPYILDYILYVPIVASGSPSSSSSSSSRSPSSPIQPSNPATPSLTSSSSSSSFVVTSPAPPVPTSLSTPFVSVVSSSAPSGYSSFPPPINNTSPPTISSSSYSTRSDYSVSLISSSIQQLSSAVSVNNSAQSSPNHTLPIAGGVVGGIALLAIILGVFLYWRRRSKTTSGYETAIRQEQLTSWVEPNRLSGVTLYMLPREHNSQSTYFVTPETVDTNTQVPRLALPGTISIPAHNTPTHISPTPITTFNAGPQLDDRGPSSEILSDSVFGSVSSDIGLLRNRMSTNVGGGTQQDLPVDIHGRASLLPGVHVELEGSRWPFPPTSEFDLSPDSQPPPYSLRP